MAFFVKEKSQLLQQALTKLQQRTPVTAIGQGSVARSLTEVVIAELATAYGAMDFNAAMGVLTSAQGSALDQIGSLFNVKRKTLSQLSATNQSVGVFYFYIDSPYGSNIEIPQGTRVQTKESDFLREQFEYVTATTAIIPTGRTRVFTSIQPLFVDSVFTAGIDTLTIHNWIGPPGVNLKCTNPKPIIAVVGYEDDSNYRVRIIKGIRTSAGGTFEAVRFAALAVNNVRDARVRVAPYGLGTMQVIITPEDYRTGQTVVAKVAAAVDAVRPVGIRMIVGEPEYAPFSIEATIKVKDTVGIDKSVIVRRAEVSAQRYINTLLSGDTLVYNKLIESLLDASELILDVSITSMQASGVEVLHRNVSVNEDQQIVPGTIRITYT